MEKSDIFEAIAKLESKIRKFYLGRPHALTLLTTNLALSNPRSYNLLRSEKSAETPKKKYLA
jgi:hypothetical protein